MLPMQFPSNNMSVKIWLRTLTQTGDGIYIYFIKNYVYTQFRGLDKH